MSPHGWGREFIQESQLIDGEWIQVTCVHGEKKLYPLAEVLLDIDGESQLRKVGAVPSLPEAVLLGTDHPKFHEYLQSHHSAPQEVSWLDSAPFFYEEIEETVPKPVKTRSEKRKERALYHQGGPILSTPVLISSDEIQTPGRSFRVAQRDDSTIQNAWEQAQEDQPEKVGPFF